MRPTSLLLAAFLIAMVPVGAASQAPLQREAALEVLSAASRWAEVEGKMQADGTFLAKEIDIVAAEDSLHMVEPEITGVIRELDRRRSSMTVLNYKIAWNEKTKISDASKHRILSSKLDNEMGAKITGHLQPDGIFQARKIRLREGTLKDGKMKYKEELVGPVEVLDASAGRLRIMRTNIRLEPTCEYFQLPVQPESAASEGTAN